MSDESGLSKIIDAIGRLKLGKSATAILTAIAILKDKSGRPPGLRWIRWSFVVTTLGMGVGYWNGLFS